MAKMKMAKIIADSKWQGPLRSIVGAVIAGLGVKYMVDGATQYAYGAGTEATAHEFCKVTDKLIRKGKITNEDYEEALNDVSKEYDD